MELSRLLDRDVARLRPGQNFVDQFGGAPELIREVWAVGHERSGLDKFADTDDCRQSRANRKRDDASTVGVNECIARNVKCVRLCLERLEGGSNILCSPDFEWRNFDAKRASHGLNLTHLQHRLGKASVSHCCQPAEPGENSRKSSSRLPAVSDCWVVNPVTLPPGRAKLAIRSPPTGSIPNGKTMGMTDVACFTVEAANAFVTMRSTFMRTNSAAISAWRAGRPSDQRYSIAILRPSVQPSSRSRCTKAAVQGLQIEASVPKNPMVGNFPACCAFAASGQAAAAPPSAASKSRRPMVTVIRPSRVRCVKGTIPRHQRAVPNGAAPGAARAHAGAQGING